MSPAYTLGVAIEVPSFQISLRPLTPADASACVALDRAAFPELPADPVRFAAAQAVAGADPAYLAVVAEVEDQVVGYGQAELGPIFGDRAFELYGIVAPVHQGRGVGGIIYDALSRHAEAQGAVRLHVQVRSDMADALAFLTRRGFGEAWQGLRMSLDLSAWDPAPWLSRLLRDDGIVIASVAQLAAVPDWPHRLWALEEAIEAQVPQPPGGVHTPSPFDDWATGTIGDEAAGGLVRDGSFVAVTADGDWVALAATRRGEEPGVLEGMLTGVAAAWQRRGLGMAVKVAATHWAKAAGWERLNVGTAGVNAGMRAINDALGFKPMPGWSRWMKPVAGAGVSAPR
ncbi:MAG: GNAT family N-acetyltransferase [Anaerolineae bacterium]